MYAQALAASTELKWYEELLTVLINKASLIDLVVCELCNNLVYNTNTATTTTTSATTATHNKFQL